MKRQVQIIERDGKPEWAVLPYELYLSLSEEAEMLQDIADYDLAKASIELGEQELVPAEVAFALLDGGNPVRVWREYRGMSQRQLAEIVGISRPYLSQIETNKRTGGSNVLMIIANALGIQLDDLVTPSET